MMTGSKKKIFMMLLAVLVLLPVLSIAVTAEDETFTIHVDMKEPDSGKVYNTQTYLYRVADAQMDENGNLHMEPVEGCKDLSFDGLTQKEVHKLVDELCKRVKSSGSTGPVLVGKQKPGKDGMIHFEQLDAGAYLLMKPDKEAPEKLEMLPALVYLPSYNQESGNWEYTVTVMPKFSWKTDPTEPKPTTPDANLPQTGLMQWQIPAFVLAGAFLVLIGYALTRKAKQD